MRKKIDFGKVDYLRHGRKDCRVVVELELKETEEGEVFTACGTIYNTRGTDCYCGGQCLDTIKEYLPKNEQFTEIHRLWKLYHLNDLHAGDREQEKAVNEYTKENRYDYKEVCNYLESKGLLVHNGYRYGTSWLFEEIPTTDLELIKKIMEI